MSLNDTDVRKPFTKRIQEGAKHWTRFTQPMHKNRKRMIDAWVSDYFAGKGTHVNHTMNLIDRAIGILVPYLAMANPQINVETRVKELRPWAYTTQLALNHLLDEIKFAKTVLRPAIFNSMFGAGIVKSGLMKAYEADVYGNHLEVGQPYAAVVDDEDYIGDVAADSREDFEMEGNYYVMPTEKAKEFFGPRHADHIKPSYKLYGDESVAEVVKSNVYGSDYHTLRYWTRFMDVYLPDEGVTITLLADDTYSKKLREVHFDGPEDGPYDFLGYKFAPKNSMPIPPAWGWIDYDTTVNTLVNKMRNQAERQKSVLAFSSESEADAEAIKNSPDGETVRVDDINNLKEVSYGGTNPENYQWTQYMEGQFSIQGGNLYQLGGRGTQAETLGQEQMLQANAGRIVDDMEQAVYDCATSIIRKLAWHVWSDPLIQIPVIKRIEGAGEVEVIFDKYAQEGDFWDFNFDLQPYSMQRFNPSIQNQKLMQFLTGWALPVAGMAAQQGVQINIDAASRKIAQYLQLDIEDFWESVVPQDGGMVGMGPYQPTKGQTKAAFGQTDDRFGASSASRQGNSNQFQSSDRAGKPSPAQN
jgi:hypothetical protein